MLSGSACRERALPPPRKGMDCGLSGGEVVPLSTWTGQRSFERRPRGRFKRAKEGRVAPPGRRPGPCYLRLALPVCHCDRSEAISPCIEIAAVLPHLAIRRERVCKVCRVQHWPSVGSGYTRPR